MKGILETVAHPSCPLIRFIVLGGNSVSKPSLCAVGAALLWGPKLFMVIFHLPQVKQPIPGEILDSCSAIRFVCFIPTLLYWLPFCTFVGEWFQFHLVVFLRQLLFQAAESLQQHLCHLQRCPGKPIIPGRRGPTAGDRRGRKQTGLDAGAASPRLLTCGQISAAASVTG